MTCLSTAVSSPNQNETPWLKSFPFCLLNHFLPGLSSSDTLRCCCFHTNLPSKNNLWCPSPIPGAARGHSWGLSLTVIEFRSLNGSSWWFPFSGGTNWWLTTIAQINYIVFLGEILATLSMLRCQTDFLKLRIVEFRQTGQQFGSLVSQPCQQASQMSSKYNSATAISITVPLHGEMNLGSITQCSASHS